MLCIVCLYAKQTMYELLLAKIHTNISDFLPPDTTFYKQNNVPNSAHTIH